MYRSRLQSLEEKRNLRKATLLSIGTILILVMAVVLGIPFLIRLAGFFGDLNSSSQSVNKSDVIPPVPPVISLPYDATNSATQTISGSSEPGSTVFLTLNTQKAGEVITTEDGSFTISNVRLDSGDNSIVAVAIDQAGNKSASSSQITLYYSNKSPKLDIESPTDHQQVSGNIIATTGQTDPGVHLTINDRFVIVNSNGKFSTNINLNPGDNGLVLIATDRSGNFTRKELTVTATP